MEEYYIFQTEQKANACINFLNAQQYYPVTGKRKGLLADDKQKTERWAVNPLEMLSGEFAVSRVSLVTLDYVGVSVEDRNGFLAVHGQDIRELAPEDFLTQDLF
jgi:hypothetical protein